YAHAHFAKYYLSAGQFSKAEKEMRAALILRRRIFGDDDRQTALAHFNLVLILQAAGNNSEATAELDNLAKHSKNFSLPLLVWTYRSLSQPAKALQICKESLDKSGQPVMSSQSSQVQLVDLYLKSGDMEGAKKAAQNMNLTGIHFKTGEFEKAESAYK